jgi:hypothetical protein
MLDLEARRVGLRQAGGRGDEVPMRPPGIPRVQVRERAIEEDLLPRAEVELLERRAELLQARGGNLPVR